MGKTYPALDVRCRDSGLLAALVDDFWPTALEEHVDSVRVFFVRHADRDAARFALAAHFPVSSVDVPDEDWARRSQENLQPITIGRLTVVSNPSTSTDQSAIRIVIPPSMGFGTGHHATTQLCLEALQAIDLAGATVLDVGTGSGLLAIAAVRLGAARAIGIDVDEDALHAARENLTLNPEVGSRVTFRAGDISVAPADRDLQADVVIANLTGHLLVQSAAALKHVACGGATLIVSGLQIEERDAVARAFGGTTVWERTCEDWVGMALRNRERQPRGE